MDEIDVSVKGIGTSSDRWDERAIAFRSHLINIDVVSIFILFYIYSNPFFFSFFPLFFGVCTNKATAKTKQQKEPKRIRGDRELYK